MGLVILCPIEMITFFNLIAFESSFSIVFSSLSAFGFTLTTGLALCLTLDLGISLEIG